eukprot:3791126-Pyramimonas_sp.AAC.1
MHSLPSTWQRAEEHAPRVAQKKRMSLCSPSFTMQCARECPRDRSKTPRHSLLGPLHPNMGRASRSVERQEQCKHLAQP